MRIMTGGTRVGARLDPLMGIEKRSRLRIVAFGTNLIAGNQCHRRVIRTMRIMAVGTIFRGGRVKRTLSPILRHFTMAAKAKSRLALVLEAGMG